MCVPPCLCPVPFRALGSASKTNFALLLAHCIVYTFSHSAGAGGIARFGVKPIDCHMCRLSMRFSRVGGSQSPNGLIDMSRIPVTEMGCATDEVSAFCARRYRCII